MFDCTYVNSSVVAQSLFLVWLPMALHLACGLIAAYWLATATYKIISPKVDDGILGKLFLAAEALGWLAVLLNWQSIVGYIVAMVGYALWTARNMWLANWWPRVKAWYVARGQK